MAEVTHSILLLLAKRGGVQSRVLCFLCIWNSICIMLGWCSSRWLQSMSFIHPWSGLNIHPSQMHIFLYSYIFWFTGSHIFCLPSSVNEWWYISLNIYMLTCFVELEIPLWLYWFWLVFKICLSNLVSMLS